jgi:hypothetical protein
MERLSLVSTARLLAGIFVLGMMPIIAQAQKAPQKQPAVNSNPSQKWLVKVSSLYYSSAKSGLTGFDCSLHPDWRELFMRAGHGAPLAPDDARLLLLNNVKLTLHARMTGGSTLEWDQTQDEQRPFDTDTAGLLDGMHQATEQIIQGFLQFWTPFIDGSAVPDSPEGLEILNSPAGHTIHTLQGDTDLTESFDSNLVLRHFDVVMNSMSIKSVPVYKLTPKGLLVQHIDAQIRSVQDATIPAHEMHAGIIYQTLDGVPIPARIKMEIDTGVFNFALDGCRVQREMK